LASSQEFVSKITVDGGELKWTHVSRVVQ